MHNLILASTSSIRRDLCQQAGLNITCEKAIVDERTLEQNWVAESLPSSLVAERLAIAKALEVSRRYPESLVIGADQTLEVGKTRLNKAETIAQVKQHLLMMRGRSHNLHASVAVVQNGKTLFSHTQMAKMTMYNFSDTFLEEYLKSEGEKVRSSVGCYQFEGKGISLFSQIKGEYHTILGMPLLPLMNFLRENNWIKS